MIKNKIIIKIVEKRSKIIVFIIGFLIFNLFLYLFKNLKFFCKINFFISFGFYKVKVFKIFKIFNVIKIFVNFKILEIKVLFYFKLFLRI